MRFIKPLSALVFAVMLSLPAAAVGMKYKTSGTYLDSAGGQHAWSINDAHALIWDTEPYIPVGGAFCSKYITFGATEEDYKADTQALDTLKSKGITDLILKTTATITYSKPAAWQRIIDYLDANGFTYGIEMNDGPRDPLRGFLISPNLYRLEGPWPDTVISRDWPGVDAAIYVVVNKFDTTLAERGGAVLQDGKITIRLAKPLASGQILIVYPHKAFPEVAAGGAGDLWSGFGEYRDRVLAFFKQIKLGPGMRFFLEPFIGKMDFTDEMAGFLPDSSGFRIGLEAYLTKKYIHEGGVVTAWGLSDSLQDVEEAARLVPLWNTGRGVPFAYDRASARLFSVDISVTEMWRDILEYRYTSAREFMNTIADALKKQVADVPIIFKSGAFHRIYANPFQMGGFDGIGAAAYGTGDVPVTTSAGPAYSLAEESGKTTWFITAATQTTFGQKTFIGYTDENSMISTLDSLREVGCKGFFVDSLQALPETVRGRFSLLSDPRQLDWLKSFKNRLKGATIAEFKPEVISYPVSPPTGAYVKRLMPGVWWLPTLRAGRTSYIGDGLFAYSILGEGRGYLWSDGGPKTVTLKAGPSGFPSVEFPQGGKIAGEKGGLFKLSLSDAPTVLRGMDFGLIFPNETAESRIAKLADLIIHADKAGLDVKKARAGIENARLVLKNGQSMIAFGIAQTNAQDLLALTGSEQWIEGEQSPAQSFENDVPAPGASAGRALVLDTDQEPPLSPYSASYAFEAASNSSYEIWIAGTLPSEGSPMSFSIDGENWLPVASTGDTTRDYAPGLSWYKIGGRNLYPGKHTLILMADGKRSVDNRYYFAIDAVVLSPRGFKPNGVLRPF